MFPHHSPSQHSEASFKPVDPSTSPIGFFLASCIQANGEIEIKIRTTERLQIEGSFCYPVIKYIRSRVLLNYFGGQKISVSKEQSGTCRSSWLTA